MKAGKATTFMLAAVAVCATAFVMAGCGGEKADRATAGNMSKKAYINIGQIISSTGVAGETSKNVSYGVTTAVNEINSNGGVSVNGVNYKFKLMTADDKENKDLAGNAYNNLKDKKIKALISPVSVESCKEIEKTVNDDNIPMMIPNISSGDVGSYDNEYRVSMSDVQIGEKAAEYAYDELNVRRVVTFREDKYAGVVDAFINRFQSLGGTIVTNNTYADAAGITPEALEDLVNASPDLIFIPDDIANAADHLDILNSTEVGAAVMGINSWYKLDTKQTQYSGLGSIYYLCENDEDMVFMAEYGAEGLVTNSLEAEYGYDAVYILKEAIEEAGAIDEDLIIAAMSMINVNGYTGDNICYEEKCDNLKEVKFRTIQSVAEEVATEETEEAE